MKNQPKFKSSKEVIAFLEQRFPKCFKTKGERYPLKIGIFQDLLIRIKDEDLISKTKLRTALRLYTLSWRYLDGIKNGGIRIDLDGNACGILDRKHIEYACKQLEAAKFRIRTQRYSKYRKNIIQHEVSKCYLDPSIEDNTEKHNERMLTRKLNVQEKYNTTILSDDIKIIKCNQNNKFTKQITDISILKPGQNIIVKVGKNKIKAMILEINKDEIRVQLSSGMAMIVRVQHLRF